jgi:hypothetical protein
VMSGLMAVPGAIGLVTPALAREQTEPPEGPRSRDRSLVGSDDGAA